MRASGKTMLGQFLKESLHADFFDLDHVFEAEKNMTIKDFIKQNSFEEFRNQEEEILKKYISGSNYRLQIIATGGGIIERINNRKLLQNHTPVIFINRDFNDILATLKDDKTRPSLTGKSLLEESTDIYNKRIPFYKNLADYTFSYSDSTEAWEVITNNFLELTNKIVNQNAPKQVNY